MPEPQSEPGAISVNRKACHVNIYHTFLPVLISLTDCAMTACVVQCMHGVFAELVRLNSGQQ